ncbi:hypothetical protein NL676_011449 [Syzygium grande]|nr:hypothetical protein NL676_011449 [Syzygium grande]
MFLATEFIPLSSLSRTNWKKSPTKSLATSLPLALPAKNLIMGQVGILKRDEENASTATTLESKVDEAKRTEEVTGSVSPPLEMAQVWTHKAESA